MAGKGEITRQRIIASVALILNRRGYEGFSMQEVMEATGLEKGGLYRHFSSKEELASEAFRYALSQSIKLRTDHLDRSHGAIALLKSLVKRFVETRSSLPGGCPLMNVAIDSDDGNPALRSIAQEALRDWKNRLGKIVRDGIRNGEIQAGTIPREIANTIIAALEGALMISRMEESRTALADVQAALYAMIDRIAAN